MPSDSNKIEPGGRPLRIGCGPLLAIGLVLLPVFYVLSAGPIVYFEEQGWLPDGMFETVYLPLNWLAEQNEWISEVLQWYIECWEF